MESWGPSPGKSSPRKRHSRAIQRTGRKQPMTEQTCRPRASFPGEVTWQPLLPASTPAHAAPHYLCVTRAGSPFQGCVAGSTPNGFICSGHFSGRFFFHFLQSRGWSGKQADQQTLLLAHPWDKTFPKQRWRVSGQAAEGNNPWEKIVPFFLQKE